MSLQALLPTSSGDEAELDRTEFRTMAQTMMSPLEGSPKEDPDPQELNEIFLKMKRRRKQVWYKFNPSNSVSDGEVI